MNHRQLFAAIKDEIQDLERFADAGGDKEFAFDLTADEDELNKMHDQLVDWGTRIRTEVGMEAV